MGRQILLGAVSALVCFALLTSTLQAHTSVESVKLPDDLGEIGSNFTFLDSSGKLRQVADFHGDVVAVFFGFTHCPNVCPGFLAKVNAVHERLGANKHRFKVVFVTVDPQRDTREALARYLELFGENVIGARIPGGELAAVARDFAITHQRIESSNGQISISHSTGAFLFNKHTKPVHYISNSRDSSYIAEQVVSLLDQ